MKFKGESMWVVKIGGSLLGSPELERWLDIFVKFSDGKIIIVPGGGVFADAVRKAQKISNMSDETAHKLALLAMDQFGHLLHSLNPKLATASTELEIDERTWQHRAIIWLPSHIVQNKDINKKNGISNPLLILNNKDILFVLQPAILLLMIFIFHLIYSAPSIVVYNYAFFLMYPRYLCEQPDKSFAYCTRD